MNKKWLCKFGLHHWKPVQRYSAAGTIVYMWPGIPCRTHHVGTGVERCSRCRVDVKGRRSLGEVAFDWVFFVLLVGAVALLVTLLVAMVRLSAPAFADIFRAAWS